VDEECRHGRGSGTLDVECERNKSSIESAGESGVADDEYCGCWCLGSMARAGRIIHEAGKKLGAFSVADEERCHCRGSGSLGLECESSEASIESVGESGVADEE
jgi:hypothetical protein